MKNKVFTLNINNYFPEMTKLTIPLMKNYANRIGAEFIEIKDRKFPDYHIHYEKLQIYELGEDSDWNIFFDADVLVNPNMFDINTSDKNLILIKDGYRVNIKFKPNECFSNDKRNQGISSCFLASSNLCHNIWKPIDLSPDEITSRIMQGESKIVTSEFYQEEYVLSYNLAKYKFNYSGIPDNSMFHSYNSKMNNKKLKEIKNKMKDWKI